MQKGKLQTSNVKYFFLIYFHVFSSHEGTESHVSYQKIVFGMLPGHKYKETTYVARGGVTGIYFTV